MTISTSTSAVTHFQLMTSLAEIASYKPCISGWDAITAARSKHVPFDLCFEEDTTLFPLIDCCDSNSFSDVCWLLGHRTTELDILVNAARACADSVAQFKTGDSKCAAEAAAANAAANAAAYAAAAAYDTDEASAVANYAANASAEAMYAATAAIDAAAFSASGDAAEAAACAAQYAKNKDFLRQAIRDFEAKIEALLVTGV